MKQDSHTSFSEKYKYVCSHQQQLPQTHKVITELAHYSNVSTPWKEPNPRQMHSFAQAIQLQTLYKCCMPAIYSLDWEEQINYKTARPITGIVAFKEIGQQYYSVDQQLALWVQSGGTRITAIKSNTSKEKLDLFLKNISALVVPEFKTQHQYHFFNLLAQSLSEQKQLPVLTLGNSALLLMSELNHNQHLRAGITLDLKSSPPDLQIFATHSDPFFANLNLTARLQIQSKNKITSSLAFLHQKLLDTIPNNSSFTILAIGKTKNQQWGVAMAKQQIAHYCFIEPKLDANNADSIAFSHKIIINFMEEVRKRTKNIEVPQTQIGNYKMLLKGDRYIYNVDNKLPKI